MKRTLGSLEVPLELLGALYEPSAAASKPSTHMQYVPVDLVELISNGSEIAPFKSDHGKNALGQCSLALHRHLGPFD